MGYYSCYYRYYYNDITKELMKIEAGKAKERQEAGVRPKKDEGARSDETVAKQFDIGKNTLRKEIAIVDNRDKLKGGIE